VQEMEYSRGYLFHTSPREVPQRRELHHDRTSPSQFAISATTPPSILGPWLRVDGPASQSPLTDVSPFMKPKTRRWRTCRDFLGGARMLFAYSQFSRNVSRDVNRTDTVWNICEAAPLRKFRDTSASWNTQWRSRQSQIRSTISTERSLVEMFASRARSIADSEMPNVRNHVLTRDSPGSGDRG